MGDIEKEKEIVPSYERVLRLVSLVPHPNASEGVY